MKCYTKKTLRDGKVVLKMKMKYTNEMFAIGAMKRINKRQKHKVRYYKCPQCGFFHIGREFKKKKNDDGITHLEGNPSVG